MITFETINVLVKGLESNSDFPVDEKQFVCVKDSLFGLLWALNQSPEVIAFTVNNGTKTNKDYKFGPMEKWVEFFDRNCYERSMTKNQTTWSFRVSR